jgi:hypothetical protein
MGYGVNTLWLVFEICSRVSFKDILLILQFLATPSGNSCYWLPQQLPRRLLDVSHTYMDGLVARCRNSLVMINQLSSISFFMAKPVGSFYVTLDYRNDFCVQRINCNHLIFNIRTLKAKMNLEVSTLIM